MLFVLLSILSRLLSELKRSISIWKIMNVFSSTYSLHRSKKIYRYGCKVFHKKRSKLNDQQRHNFENRLSELEQAIKDQNVKEASRQSHLLNDYLKTHYPKNLWDQGLELAFALVFAIVVAFAIRQVWFELYEVPTGSMRPTIEEKDRLVVSKTTFGINLPFSNQLALFKPEYVKRAGIFVFTVLNMDVSDADTVYFYLFPGKKRYIKRAMGKAGDTLYFYGGRIYGIDKDNNEITETNDENYLKQIGIEKIDYVPYINFDGKISVDQQKSRFPALIMNQMNIPVGKLQLSEAGLTGSFFNGTEWVKDDVAASLKPHQTPQTYADLWGFKNYAMVRLLTPEKMLDFTEQKGTIDPDAIMYLEIFHTANLSYPKPQIRRDESGIMRPMITPYVTYLPIHQKHLDAIHQSLYTARFVVKNERAYRYHEGNYHPQRVDYDVSLPHVADGTYEFYYGKAFKVGFGGTLTELSSDHPLYNNNPEMIQKLFNLGIHFNTIFNPTSQYQPYMPQRFAYFRKGEFYTMGAPIMAKDDPILKKFIQSEQDKQNQSTAKTPYVAFVDSGPPIKDAQLDKDFIRNFGLKIPDDNYLALGDNFAMSADSRDFGFVPAMNLRGAPSFLIWPFSKKLGTFPQTNYPWLTLPNILVWTLVLIIFIAWCVYVYYRDKKFRN